VIGSVLLVVVIGTPARGAAEEALRRGWVLAAVCFAAVAISSVLLGRARHLNAAADEFESPLRVDPPASGSTRGIVSLPAELPPAVDGEADPLGALPLFRGLDPAALTELRDHAEQVELEAGSYLFHARDPSDSLYVLRSGRLQVLQNDMVLRELGRGEVLGELGILIDAPRSASVLAVRDSTLIRLTKGEFEKIADAGVFAALVRVLARRLHQNQPPTVRRPPSPAVVVAVVGVDANALASMVATGLITALSARLRVVNPAASTATGWNEPSGLRTKLCCTRAPMMPTGGSSACGRPTVSCCGR